MKKNSHYWIIAMIMILIFIVILTRFFAMNVSVEKQIIVNYYGSLAFTITALSFLFYQTAKLEIEVGRVYMSGYNLVASGRLFSSVILWIITISNFLLILFWVIAATLPNFFPELYTKLAVKVLPMSILIIFITIGILVGARYTLWSEKNLQRG